MGVYKKPLAYLCGLLSTFRVSTVNYYLVCSFPINKICAISVLMTTENSDDLEIRVHGGSRSLKVTPVNSSCVISY